MTRLTDRRHGFAVALASLALVALVALCLLVNARSGWLHTLDTGVDRNLNSYVRAHRGQLWFWKAVSAVGGPSVFRIGALVGAVLLWWRRRRSAALFLAVAVGGTVVLSSVVKQAVGRHRPVLGHPVVAVLHSKSFPSAHALTSAVTLGAVVMLVWPYVRHRVFGVLVAVAALIAVLVGFSRLILGYHYPTDVVGAWLLGGLWLGLVVVLFAPHRRRTLPPPRQRIGSGR